MKIRTILLAMAVGVVTAAALFFQTVPQDGCCHRVGERTVDAGYIDPWTGESRPVITSWSNESGGVITQPREGTSGPFIPLPVGFLIGVLLVLVPVVALEETWPKRLRTTS